MEVKGAAIVPMEKFITENFGEESYALWFDSLSQEAKEVYKAPFSAFWYPMKEILIDPTEKICEILYEGNIKGAWECGRFSAQHALKGIYKIFIKFGSPGFLLSKASTILPQYYKPSDIKILNSEKNSATMQMMFEESYNVLEYRIGGWIEAALEISGCKNVSVKINSSLAKGDEATEYSASWE